MKRVTKIDALPNKRPGDRATDTRRVAVYARVSTESDEQLTSLEAQKDYYRKMINDSAEWVLAGVYSDDGVSGLTARHRAGFLQMIEDCENGKIDMIFTKSVSRFARNTVDSLKTIRRLTELGIGVMFSKENIWTLDSKGEFVLTLMSSFAQEESRSISENVAWGKRKRFQDGIYGLGWKNFLGYQKAPGGEIVIVESEAAAVRRIFRLHLAGKSPSEICKYLEAAGIPTPSGKGTWYTTVINSILTNEKYKGAALLQKTFVVDYLNKKQKRNEGELPQYYIEHDHEPIIAPALFDYVQEEKTKHLREAGQLFGLSALLVCSKCGRHYAKYAWHSSSYDEHVWQCKSRQIKQGYCQNAFIYDQVMEMVLSMVFGALLERHPGVLSFCADLVGERVGELAETFTEYSLGDLILITETISVNEDWTMQFKFINGESLLVELPLDYEPRRNNEGVVPRIIKNRRRRDMKREQEYRRLTGEQKDAIRVLWSNGWGSKKIARYMGLNLDTVKSHCRRHLQEHGVPRGGLGETWGICKNCNKIITYTPNKKKKEFCSDSCRYAWWRAHNKPSEKEGDAHATFICQQCGKEFIDRKGKKRKYCSQKCYAAARKKD